MGRPSIAKMNPTILERLALVRVKSFTVESPNFCPLQSAYRTAHSTETALVKIVDSILQDIDSGSVVSLMSLDISAAFDTICHHTLLIPHEHDFGLCGNILSWFQSYLSGRTFSVRVGPSSGIPVLLHTGLCPRATAIYGLCLASRSLNRKLQH
jgi:Reverse transcriptase (RNA-dependent DNA polymerase)